MISNAVYRQADSISSPTELDSSLSHDEAERVDLERQYLRPNLSIVREQETVSASQRQLSTDVGTPADLGLEGYHSGAVASQVEPGKFQQTRLLTSSEVRQRAYEALRGAELQRESLRELKAECFEDADE